MKVMPQLPDFFCSCWRNESEGHGFLGFLGVMEMSGVFLGSSCGSIRVMGILPKLGHLFGSMEVMPQLGDFLDVVGEMQDSEGFLGLLGGMEESGVFLWSSCGSIRVMGILPKLGHLFGYMEVMTQLRDFLVTV